MTFHQVEAAVPSPSSVPSTQVPPMVPLVPKLSESERCAVLASSAVIPEATPDPARTTLLITASQAPGRSAITLPCLAVPSQALKFKRVSLLGWSDGGITALVAAARYPSYISKMVIWGANTYVTDEDERIYLGRFCCPKVREARCSVLPPAPGCDLC